MTGSGGTSWKSKSPTMGYLLIAEVLKRTLAASNEADKVH